MLRFLRRQTSLLLCSSFFCLLGCSNDGAVDSSSVSKQGGETVSGHDRMLALLEQAKDKAPDEFPFFGARAHIKARREFNAMGSYSDRLRRFGLLRVLGRHELFYEENPDNAIQHLTEAYDLFAEMNATGNYNEYFEAWNETTFHLAVACLRRGEVENCCSRYAAESCVLPIRGGGVHSNQQGSRQAIEYFLQVLENVETGKSANRELGHSARWLLNIAYMTLDEYPAQVPEKYRIPTEYFQSEVEFPLFQNVAPKLSLETFNLAGGAIVDDFDNDDYLDIFTSSSDPAGQTRFFRNNRDGTFSDRTKEAGLTGFYGGLNIVQADFNNDGHLDVFIMRGAWHRQFGRPNSLLRNNGNATFTDVTFEAGLGEHHYPTKTACWADFDNDGDLDLFVGNEYTPWFDAPCQLFRNNGDETFTDIAAQAGIQSRVFSMASVWGDYDHDRYPDLYLGGGSPDNPQHTHLFRNRGNETFEDVALKLGMTRPKFSFPAWFWDFDNDGNLDLYLTAHQSNVGLLAIDSVNANSAASNGIIQLTTDFGIPPGSESETWEFELPGFYRGNGQGGFDDVAPQQNLNYPTEPMGANFGDVNGDGYLDFYLATGNVPYWELRPNVMFLNNGGQGFSNVTMGGGFGHLQKGHGVSFADIDNDGDQDVYVQMGGQLPGDKYYDALFENPGFGHHWITIKLIGNKSNHSAIGARIHVKLIEDGQPRSIFRYVNSGGSFGCNPLRQNIGLGHAEKIESIEIYWPTTDQTQTFPDVALDQAIQITEGEKRIQKLELNSFVLGGPS